MRKLIFVLALFGLVLVVGARPVLAANKIVTVRKGEVINRSFYVNAGELVEIFGTVNGDVYVAGGQVLVDGVVNGDVIAGGGEVNVTGTVSDDVRVAGGDVTISGLVGKSVTAFGGSIELSPESEVAEGAVLGGGSISLLGPVRGDLLAFGGSVILSNEVTGNADIMAGSMRVTSEARVGGDLNYTSDEPALIDEAAVIEGETRQKESPVTSWRQEVEQATGFVRDAAGAGVLAMKVVNFIAILVLGLILLRMMPIYTKQAAEFVAKEPWKALGVGLATLILTPIIVVLLMVTLIGVPVALILVLFFLIYLYLSKIVVAYWLGREIRKLSDQKIGEALAYVIGLVAITLLLLMPYAGRLVAFLMTLAGLGAALVNEHRFYLSARKEKII